MGGVTVRGLGPVEFTVGGQPLEIGGAKQRSVLAVLALSANRVVPVDSILEAVWGDATDASGHALQQHISTLRKLLDPERAPGVASQVLTTRPPGYLLRVDESDVDDFEQVSANGFTAADEGRPEDALGAFDIALRLWRGAALADLRDVPWFDAVAHRLEQRRLAVIEARIDLLLRQGSSGAVIGELESLTQDHPYHERFWAQLMLALYRGGRQADALSAYQRARGRLLEDLGVEPTRALRELEATILTQSPSLDTPGSDDLADIHATFREDGPATGHLRLPDGQVVALRDGTTLIGRTPHARVRLVDSRVSRRHAQIESSDGRHVLVDLGSTNGTKVNDQSVASHDLATGDVIDVGGVELRFT